MMLFLTAVVIGTLGFFYLRRRRRRKEAQSAARG